MLLFFFFTLSFLLIFCGCDVPVYLFRNCPDTTFNASNYTTYQSNCDTLLSYISSNSNNAYSNATVGQNPNAVYGLYYCRGDVTHDVCSDCVNTAVQEMNLLCPKQEWGYIWYDRCMFRYSNHYFFSTLSEDPLYYMPNTQNISNATRFSFLLEDTMNKTATEAMSNSMRFATREANFTRNQTLYCLAQCSPDLSWNNCSSCLVDAVADLPSCCSGRRGGRVVNPSCNIRFEIYPFYRVTAPAPSPVRLAPPPPSNRTPTLLAPPPQSNRNTIAGKQGNSSRKIVSIVVVVVAAGVILLSVILYYLLIWKKRQDPSEENDGNTFISAESLQFDLSTVFAATNNFTDVNKIGSGGFGDVFKGILPNGQEIAVKRLSGNSNQGAEEFKNEVVLVAKLQHQNLVRLLGFCLEGEEKILIYELVHNKSLDYFLFDLEKCVQLDWQIRYKIIGGIARGLLYLHEDSRLRIIHRDLKTSNILLDGEMNPQISDFGTARIFGMEQTEGNTSKIVGTLGYMSPEYAMHGEFSVKSDVFSFGIVVLEIVSGKRNRFLYQQGCAQDLRTYAWRHWFAGTAFELVDPIIRENCLRSEVMRCIHIGLLCVQEDVADRPTMASVVLMLNSYLVTPPLPSQPLFLKEGREMQEAAESDRSKTNSKSSVNEM